MNNYSRIEKTLLKQGKFHISLELNRINFVLDKLNNPQNKLKIIHVAGTNGKGSTCSIINQILIEQGYKTGLYTSPHLVKYNERIKINNHPISDEKFLDIIEKVVKISDENNIKLTEFEILTTVMYQFFYEEKVDVAVVEVGLGGRFDATNCINSPLLSIITSISLDHTERLGKTIEEIAKEKAGIIKNNTPIILDKNNNGYEIIKKIAEEKSAPIIHPKHAKININNNKNFIEYNNNQYELNLFGEFQNKNCGLALCAIETLKNLNFKISPKSTRNGLKKVQWTGRFQYIKDKNIILDGCHNPDGAKILKESLNLYFPNHKRKYIYTSLKNKDYKEIQSILFDKKDCVYHFKMEEANFITQNDIPKATKSIDINELEKLTEEKRDNELLIICGSLYALGNILGKIKLCS